MGKLVNGDCQGEEEGEGGAEEGDASLSGSFRPGKVVWAKVDGYQWWPAKVTTVMTSRTCMFCMQMC